MQTEQSLRCQNCHLPLQVDSSLLNLSLAQRDLLVANPGINTDEGHGTRRAYTPQDRLNLLKNVRPVSQINDELRPSNIEIVESYMHVPQSAADQEAPSISRQSSSSVRKGDVSDSNDDTDLMGMYTTEKTLSNQVNMLTNVFNILSARSTVDYPVCQDCCTTIASKLRGMYNMELKQRDVYRSFLEKLERQSIGAGADSATTSKQDNEKSPQQSKEQLLNELKSMEDENDKLDAEIADLRSRLAKQQQIRDSQIMQENISDLGNIEFQKEIQLLNNQYTFALNNLDQLRKTNIYNETFKISHDGVFGTINSLRLGGYPDCPVSWNEINAAMGQVVLLLATIVARLNIKLKEHKLKPMGSLSKISRYDASSQEWEEYEAYSNESFKFSKLFKKETNFDKALVALVDIINQMTAVIVRPAGAAAATAAADDANTSTGQDYTNPTGSINRSVLSDTGMELPYHMSGGTVNDIPVRLHGSEPSIQWTTAMKCLLTNVKWLLAYSSVHLTTLQRRSST